MPDGAYAVHVAQEPRDAERIAERAAAQLDGRLLHPLQHLGGQHFLTGRRAAVTEVEHALPVRACADLTAAAGSPETDHGRKLGPVDGVEEAVLRPDRHDGALCHPA